MENKYTLNSRVFKAFCDENRLMILEMLQTGEKCACHLLDQMNILCESGIVVSRKEGKWTYYSISSEGSEYAVELLKQLTEVNIKINLDNTKCCT